MEPWWTIPSLIRRGRPMDSVPDGLKGARSAEKALVSPRLTVDCTMMSCPEPLMKAMEAVARVDVGEGVLVIVRTPAAREDIERWAAKVGHRCMVEARRGKAMVLVVMGVGAPRSPA